MFGRAWVGRAALLLLGLLHQHTAGAHKSHITSFEDVLSTQPQAQDYSVVNHVSIASADGDASLAPDAPFPASLHVELRTTHGVDLAFDVQLKRDLYAPETFVWAHEGPELALMKSHQPRHIAYEGKLPHGYIRLTMFDANKFHATIKLHDKVVVVDPVEHHKNAHQLASPVTGLVAYTIPLAAATISKDHHHRHLTATYGRMAACTWTPRQITVGVASDAGFTSEHGGAAQTQSYLVAVYNSINGLYDDQVGVHLTIGAFLIQTAAGGPAWNVEPQSCGTMVDMSVQLNAVKSWVAGGGIPLCNQENCGLWHVHTNCDADHTRTGNTAGLAWVGTLCSSTMGYNTGVSIDAGAMTWVIVGHEIGHNFGAGHTFAEGGIMSYDWNSPMKFHDNGQVCTFVQTVLDKCVKPYNADGATTTAAPTTTTVVPVTTTARPTTTRSITTTTPTPTTTRTTTTTRPTTTSVVTATPELTATTTPPPPATTPAWDPCACSTENMCREVYRPGCLTFLDKKYCYVVGYEQCTRAKPSATCTNIHGKTLYFLEFDDDCPIQPPAWTTTPTPTQTQTTTTATPTTTTNLAPSTTPNPTTTASPATTTESPATTTESPATTTESPATTTESPATTTESPATTTSSPASTTSVPNTTTAPNATSAPTATSSTSAPPSTTTPSDPCSCSTDSKCPTIVRGGCQSFHGRSWCYVKDPSKCVGASYHDSVDCAGQKYMQCDPSTNASLPPPPKDPCACSKTVKCPSVSSQPGCFKSNRASYCFVEDPAKCFGPSVRTSQVCPRQKLRRCSSLGTSATHWVVGEWSKCTKLCGGGVKTRTVACMDEKETIGFNDTACTSPKPVDILECNVRSCPVTAFNNTTPCAGPPHSTCKPRARKHLCDCACHAGYLYHPRRRECVPLPPVEFRKLKCPECPGSVRGPQSFEIRSHDIDPLEPTVCNGQEDDATTVSASWLAAFEPDTTATTSTNATEGTNVAMIAIATCIAAIALVLVVLAYRRRNALQPTTQIQTPVYIVGSTPGAML